MHRAHRRALALFSLALPVAAGCGGGSDDGGVLPFVLQATSQAVAGTTPVRISGTSVAYLADEAGTAGGSSFNTDADTIDSVVFVVDLVSRAQRNTRVAARDMLWIGSHLYMRVSEALDEVDWNGNMNMTDQVLLHWSVGTSAVFVETLAAGDRTMLASDGRLFIARSGAAPGTGRTSLAFIESSDPLMPQAIGTTSANVGGLRPVLIGEDEGLVFVTMDETVDGDLNTDMDGTDAFVLGLIDAGAAMPMVYNVELAVANADVPRRAYATGASDWLVGFLVNEAAQAEIAMTGYNDRTLFAGTWEPPQCMGTNDVDTLDNVLFFLNFADFIDSMAPVPPVNTGLVGVDRVVVVEDFVGTISLEMDDGPCDLNNDADSDDRIFRWVEATMPVLPPVNMNILHALAGPGAVPGGTAGVAELDERFVILVSEADDSRNHDGDLATTFNLLGWFNPGVSSAFTFNHGVGGPFYGGARWMRESTSRGQLYIGRPENIDGTNENILFGADTDILDSLPTFLEFEGSRMAFPTARVATHIGNTGSVVVGNLAVYRVSEADETLDYNGDGDMTDYVLFRSSMSAGGFTTAIGLLNDLPRAAMEVNPSGTVFGAAILTDESYAGTDLNGDGDATDYVLRHFRL